MLIHAPKGTNDILPDEIYKWQYIEKTAAKVCRNFSYKEIRTPVFEHTELFKRGVGETTDIVQKEMYTFLDKGQRSISLRPEGTAGIVRSYIEHGMSSLSQPVKLYYDMSAYRYENVQKGRYREFHQFGAEAFGSVGPAIDAEIISLIVILFKKLGISEVTLNINSTGCKSCRTEYNMKLKEYLKPKYNDLCDLCKDRYERNPMRIIDCKDKKCQSLITGLPALLDNICDECRIHFEGFKAALDNLGIGYVVNTNIVRGLDYYSKTVFEFLSENVGAQKTVCAGGRYDGLIEACGGPSVPGIGFALGIERLLMEMEAQAVPIPKPEGVEIFIAAIGEKAVSFAGRLVYNLRAKGVSAETDHMGRSIKAQMKYADKINATNTIVIGDNEIDTNKAVLRNMKTGESKDVSLDSILDRLTRIKDLQ